MSRSALVRDVGWPLGGMLLTQTLAVMVFVSVPVMATEIAREAGVQASTIGIYTSVVFAAAMFVSVASGSIIARYGAIRANQVGLIFSAMAVLLAVSASMPLILLSALLVGIGYGPNTPSGSHVLARVTPPRSRGLVFSIKQSGAPIGGMLAGLTIPFLVESSGWRWALVATALAAAVAAVVIQPLRSRLDDDRKPGGTISVSGSWSSMGVLLKSVPLRRLTFMAFALTVMHSSMFSFLTAHLVERVSLSLTTAGLVYAAMHVAGALARVVWGWTADRVLGARTVLLLVSVVAVISTLLIASFTPQWTLSAMMAVAVAAGASSAGWNGVFLAEVVRLSPKAEVGAATGGALFFVYGGLVVGPMSFAGIVSLSGSYAPAYGAIALLTLLAALNLLRRTPQGPEKL